MDYGDLIWTTLSRARSAREAIKIMDELTQAYGYASSGESFGVGDSEEVWLLEMMSKGKYAKGSVWVASRVPEGYVGAAANQARTTTFVQNDPETVRYSADVISFARSIGAYNGTDADFNFRQAYDPISFIGARICEARVWNLLNPACGGCLDGYLDYAQGYNLTNVMPLFVPVARKLALEDTVTLMRTHFEGTWFDNTGNVRPDVGAGAGHSPYRERSLVWGFNGSAYLNERTVGIQCVPQQWRRRGAAAGRGRAPRLPRTVSHCCARVCAVCACTCLFMCLQAERLGVHCAVPWLAAAADPCRLVVRARRLEHEPAHPNLWRRDADPPLLRLAVRADAIGGRRVRPPCRLAHHEHGQRLLGLEPRRVDCVGAALRGRVPARGRRG
jgi:hypothetical protein